MSVVLRLRNPGRGLQDRCLGCPSSPKYATEAERHRCTSGLGSPQWSAVRSCLLIQAQDQLLYKELYKYFLNEWRKKVQEVWFKVFK